MRPAVSVGESSPVLDGVPDEHGEVLQLGATDPASHLGASFGLSAPADTDSYVLESGLLSSPSSVDFEGDYLAGDSAALFSTESFDISQFLNEDGSAVVSGSPAANGHAVAADAELGLHFADLENYFSSENINLQPQSGASATGCDDGGIAVGI